MKYIKIVLFLMSGAALSDVHDRGIFEGKIRTEYEVGKGTGSDWLNLMYVGHGLYGDEGCLFDASASNNFGCPGRNSGVQSDWFGNTQVREYCNGDSTPIGDSWLGCLSYASSPYFSIGNPQGEYWVVHANNDPSFDQCREGPPSLSEPIADHGVEPEELFNITTSYLPGVLFNKEIKIKINAAKQNPYCNGALEGTFPFLSVGSHYGAGNPEIITTLTNDQKRIGDVLNFTMEVKDYTAFDCQEPSCPNEVHWGSHAGFFVIAEWSSPANPGDPSVNYPKFVWVDLIGTGVESNAVNKNSTTKWNWPIYDSLFWPGGEIAVIGANTASTHCPNINIPSLTIGAPQSYAIKLTDLFRCASDTLNRFQTPMPHSVVNVTGVHFFIEAANATVGELEISIQDVRMEDE